MTRIGRRRSRSTQTPAGSVKSRNGRNSTVPSRATWNALASSTTMAAIGSASAEIWLPNWLIVWPAQSLRKSGCRHSPPRGQSVFSLLAMDAMSVSVRRGGTVEARHRVHAVAVRDGEVVAAAGDPGLVCLFRSSAKPIQALLLARARPDLDDREIAIACASHRAEPAQIAAVRSLLAKAPATRGRPRVRRAGGPRRRARSTTTARGSTRAFSPSAARAAGRRRATGSPTTRCSRSCRRRSLGSSDLPPTTLPTAVDGCGVVTFGLSLERMAAVVRRLAAASTAPSAMLAAMRARSRARGRRGLARHAPHVRTARLGGEGRRRGPALRNRAGRHGLCAEVRGRQPSPSPGGARAASRTSISVPCSSRAHAAKSSAVVGLDPEDVAAYEKRLARGCVGGPPRRLDRPIEIADYDPAWPSLYEREEARLRAALGDRIVRLEHAGSTSVPALPAKPIIDIVLEVADAADEDAYMPDLEAAGYVLRFRETEWCEHRLFKGPDTNVNLHVFTAGCEETDRMLLFRDRLRRDDADRVRYARAKRELATRDWKYRQQYADAKTAIVAEIMSRAEAAKQGGAA